MDPDATLEQIRALVRAVLSDTYDGDKAITKLLDLAEDFQSLDDWLTRGGYKPSPWHHEEGTMTHA